MNIAFRFTPYKTQTHIAEIVMITQADTLYRSIIGKGVEATSVEVTDKIDIYPNPVSSSLYIGNTDGVEWLSIIDISGNEVLRKSRIGNSMDVSDLPNGVYYLAINTHSGAYLKKFIKVE